MKTKDLAYLEYLLHILRTVPQSMARKKTVMIVHIDGWVENNCSWSISFDQDCTCEITNIHEHVCRLTRSKLKKLGGMKKEGLVTWM